MVAVLPPYIYIVYHQIGGILLIMTSLSLRGEPTVPSILTTKPNVDYLTWQRTQTSPYPIFLGSIEERKLCFEHGFYVYLRPMTYHSLLANPDKLYCLQCICERVFAMTHLPEDWITLMGRHYIEVDWYDYCKTRM